MAQLRFIGFLFFALVIMAQKALCDITLSHSTARILVDQEKENTLHKNHDFWVCVSIDLKKGFHAYWKNPGDSGAPPLFNWTLPKGFSASEIHYPPPKIFRLGPLIGFGYEEKAHYLVKITPPPASQKTLFPQNLTLDAEWLVCDDTSCLPQYATFTIPFVKNTIKATEHVKLQSLEMLRQQLPVFNQALRGTFYALKGKTDEEHKTKYPYLFRLPYNGLSNQALDTLFFEGDLKDFWFDKENEEILGRWHDKEDMHTRSTMIDKGFSVSSKSYAKAHALSLTFDGYIKTPIEKGQSFHASLATKNPPLLNRQEHKEKAGKKEHTSPPSSQFINDTPRAPLSLISALILAFLGGIILNLMPCVFPILSLKVMAFTSQGGQYSCRQKRHAWAYTGGILVSFFIVSFILFMLQKAGALVGWGFQMQSPPFVMLLFFILFLVGLNLSGFFHLSGIGGDAYHRLSQEHSLRSSFFTGILATAVATPCTAPLMASALGYALSAPFHENILIFQSLGLGLAFPFLFMAYVPFIAKNLPKPGLWMVTLKEVLAFLMYASAVWLLWVLSIQIGPYGVLLGGGAMVWITFLIWLMQRSPRFYKIGIVCLILSITGALILTPNILAPQLLLNEHRDSSHASNVSSKEKNDVEIIPFDKEKLESLRKQGRSVFVEVTAAWCLTCKFNEISVLNTKDIQTLFKNTNTILMIADWTNKDPQITQYLGSFGAQGVPFYVHYHGEKTPTVLGSVLLNKDTMHKILHPLLPKEPKSPKS